MTDITDKVTEKLYLRRYSQIDTLLRRAVHIYSKKGCRPSQYKTRKEDHVINDEAELLTVREVAKQLRVDDTTVRRWIKNGALEAITLPHRGTRQAYRIRRVTLETLLASPQQTISKQL